MKYDTVPLKSVLKPKGYIRGPFGSALKRGDMLETGVPVYEQQHAIYNSRTFRFFISPAKAMEMNRFAVEENDLIISCSGTVGMVSLIQRNDPKGIISQALLLLRANPKIVNPVFLSYFFKSQEGYNSIISRSSGSVQVNISKREIIESIPIPLPPIDVQKKIAAILSALDEKIAINRAINDNLYEMVNAYYTSLFKDVECEMTTIDNYAERIYSGGTPATSNATYWGGAFGWFSSGETRNRFVISTEKSITQTGIDNSSTKLAVKHDIVMASAGQGFTRGQTSMLLIDTYVNQSVIVIHADRNILPYLFWNLANRYEELRAISDSSSIRGSLTTKMIAAFEIPLANNDVIQTFSDFAWAVIPKIENNLLENERLVALRDSLLPKLMSGEIDVSAVQF